MTTPTLDNYGHTIAPYPTPVDAFATFNTDPATPTAIHTNHPEVDHSNDSNDDNRILNYYFLLLAVILVFLGILYLTFARRQRQRRALHRQNSQRALARDLERWGGGGPFGPGRFRLPRNNNGLRPSRPRAEEGLNESGEAPPPYVPKEPKPAHVGRALAVGNSIPLNDLSTMDHKPPDYDEGPSSRYDGRWQAGTDPIMRGE
ncbi:MAG: hypothetical protein Q9226_006701 [Calogaya cf. arnoldii]